MVPAPRAPPGPRRAGVVTEPDALLGCTVTFANPAPDVYGSDLQLLESVSAVVGAGGRAVVALPHDGPLVPLVRERGGEVELLDFPVVRRATQSVGAFAGLAWSAVAAVPRLTAYLRRTRPTVLYVNTVTLPWWLLAARLTRTPSVCHVHEAENADSMVVRRLLVTPLRLADALLVISKAALSALTEVDEGLRAKANLVYNGVPEPPDDPGPAPRGRSLGLITVGRLSPRKAPHLALEAVAALRREGHDLTLEVAGSVYPGYEWYETQLRERAAEPDLAGAVTFPGYCKPIWPHLAAADVVVQPSLREPFGNAVVEAQLSLRPVVATSALGHLESIEDGRTGLLFPPDDVPAMTDAIRRLVEDPELAASLAAASRAHALAHFSPARYGREVVAVVAGLAARRRRAVPSP